MAACPTWHHLAILEIAATYPGAHASVHNTEYARASRKHKRKLWVVIEVRPTWPEAVIMKPCGPNVLLYGSFAATPRGTPLHSGAQTLQQPLPWSVVWPSLMHLTALLTC